MEQATPGDMDQGEITPPMTSQAPKTDLAAAMGDSLEVWKQGRPYKYSNLAEMQSLIETYFLECEAVDKRPNVSGLALALHTSYKMLNQWESLRPGDNDPEEVKAFKKGISTMVAHAKTRCAAAWWPNLEDRDKARGAEFALKVMGHHDKPDYAPAQGQVFNQTNVIVGNGVDLGDLFGGLLPKVDKGAKG